MNVWDEEQLRQLLAELALRGGFSGARGDTATGFRRYAHGCY